MNFYYFSHILQPWVLPPGLNLAAAIFGFTISRYLKRAGQMIIAIALMSLWFFCTPITAQLLMNELQRKYSMLDINKISKQGANAIVVLSGDYEHSLKTKKEYMLSSPAQSRIHYAAFFYKKTHFPVITSGGSEMKSMPSGAELMRQQMKNYFNAVVKWTEDKSINTRDQGIYIIPLLKAHGIKTVYLITNAWHMPRAMYTFNHSFRHTDIKIIPAPMGYSQLQPSQGIANYLPSFRALNKSATAMHEYTGILAYWLSNLLNGIF